MMNERIQELAERAIANVRFWKGCNQESYGVDEHELAKFAELIVEECTHLLEVEYGESTLSGNEVGRVLNQHFGVK